jgi:hypothetical protein
VNGTTLALALLDIIRLILAQVRALGGQTADLEKACDAEALRVTAQQKDHEAAAADAMGLEPE